MPEEHMYRSMLLDYYGDLLTARQRECYDLHYNEDLSLSEIAEQFGISRQGIHDTLRRVDAGLEAYEAKLGLVRQFRQIREKAEQIRLICRELEEDSRHREDIARILADCPQEKCLWVEPEPVRRDAFKAILRSGDPMEIIRLIRTLYERKAQLTACGKKLRTSDTAFLKDAERLLHEEFAYVLDIAPAEVPAYIRQHLPE